MDIHHNPNGASMSFMQTWPPTRTPLNGIATLVFIGDLEQPTAFSRFIGELVGEDRVAKLKQAGNSFICRWRICGHTRSM